MLTLTLYFGSVIVAETCLVPIFSSTAARAASAPRPSRRRSPRTGRRRRQVVRAREHVAAADVDLVGERQRDRLAGDRVLEIAVHRDDARDGAFAARGQHADLVPCSHHAARDRAGEAAEIEVRAVDPLHRQAERTLLRVVLDVDGLQVLHQRRAVIPGRVLARVHDVVAAQGRQRDRDELLDADLPGERRVVLDDLVEDASSSRPGPSC